MKKQSPLLAQRADETGNIKEDTDNVTPFSALSQRQALDLLHLAETLWNLSFDTEAATSPGRRAALSRKLAALSEKIDSLYDQVKRASCKI